jgi:hypothetical protein
VGPRGECVGGSRRAPLAIPRPPWLDQNCAERPSGSTRRTARLGNGTSDAVEGSFMYGHQAIPVESSKHF